MNPESIFLSVDQTANSEVIVGYIMVVVCFAQHLSE